MRTLKNLNLKKEKSKVGMILNEKKEEYEIESKKI